MDKNVWGKPMWSTIHLVALGYPEYEPSADIVVKYHQFFISLGYVIPCDECRTHYNSMLADMPPVLENRDTLFKWTIDIHNMVNERLGKDKVTYEEGYNMWKNKQPDHNIRNNNTDPNYYIYTIYTILIILIGTILVTYISPKLRGKRG